jgi:hypothetical protein
MELGRLVHLALVGQQPRNLAQRDRPRPLIAQGLKDGQRLLTCHGRFFIIGK